jgi:hypothetical protein
MSEAEFHRFIRLVLRAACEVQRLVWALGISDGTVSLAFHAGDAKPLKLDVTRWADAHGPQPHDPGLGASEADHHTIRLDLAQLRADVELSLRKMAEHAVFWLGGRPFDLGFGGIEFTIRHGMAHDFVVARRVLFNSSEGFGSLPAVG